MRYSVVEIKALELSVTPLPSLIGISDGDDMTLSYGDLSNYTLIRTDTDGVRLYRLYRSPYIFFNMLFIPETHQYFNASLLISNFSVRKYKGSLSVSKILHKIKGTLS